MKKYKLQELRITVPFHLPPGAYPLNAMSFEGLAVTDKPSEAKAFVLIVSEELGLSLKGVLEELDGKLQAAWAEDGEQATKESP